MQGSSSHLAIAWFENPRRPLLVSRDHRLVRISTYSGVVSIAAFVVAISVYKLGAFPSVLYDLPGVIAGLSAVATFATLNSFAPRFRSYRSWYSPSRAGFSPEGGSRRM